MAKKHMKDSQHHQLLGKYNSKFQQMITSPSTEWPLSKKQKITSVGKNVEKLEPCELVVGR